MSEWLEIMTMLFQVQTELSNRTMMLIVKQQHEYKYLGVSEWFTTAEQKNSEQFSGAKFEIRTEKRNLNHFFHFNLKIKLESWPFWWVGRGRSPLFTSFVSGGLIFGVMCSVHCCKLEVTSNSKLITEYATAAITCNNSQQQLINTERKITISQPDSDTKGKLCTSRKQKIWKATISFFYRPSF